MSKKPAKPKPISGKRLRFVHEYPKDFNAAAAARRSGYSERTAKDIGAELLRDHRIQAAIAELQQRQLAKTDITVERVLKEYERLAFSRIDDIFDLAPESLKLRGGISEDAVRAIATVEATSEIEDGNGDEAAVPVKVRRIKIKLHDKLRALDVLRQYLGLDKPDAKAQRALEQLLEEMKPRVKRELYDELLECVAAIQGDRYPGVAEGTAQREPSPTQH
jgi:phage terminase small subunit